ncbi:MAG TPA: TonB family protein [Aggregicoccus sp.]|nr:TonB family protein [Aggregicoccus sp.]
MQTNLASSHAARTPDVDPLIGRVLHGRFTVLEPLGAGGMGRVYRALQAPLERVVALKVLNPSFPTARDPDFLRRFLREASLTAKLRNPHTVTIIDYGQTDDGVYYIAMEYLEGRTLAEWLSTGPLAWERVADMGQQLCRSLREAHRLGVVHRDLKPANVMVLKNEDGRDREHVKVLDFGLVKSFVADEGERAQDITQSGTFLGSPLYMAPEQARNTADARSDVYSLGVLLFQMLVGRPPFVHRDHLELIFAHHKEAPPRFKELRADLAIPEALEAVVRRCLEKDPARRFQGMDALLEALRQLSPGGTTGPLPAASDSGPLSTHSGAGTLALDISVEEAPAAAGRDAQRAALPASRAGLSGRGPLLLTSAALLLALGGLAALLLTRPVPMASPAAVTQPVAPVPAAPAAAAAQQAAPPVGPVRFRIASVPSGARVLWRGEQRGVTPLVLEVPAGEDGVARAELTFLLEGYNPERILAGGSGEVFFTQRLQKRPASAKPGSVAALPPGVPAPPEAYAPPAPEVKPAAAVVPMASAAPAVVQRTPELRRSSAPIQLPERATPPVELGGNAQPEFPRAARASGMEGLVILKIVVTESGTVGEVQLMRGEEPFASAALAAVRSWRYRPALVEGRPTSVYRIVRIPFRLRG